MERLTFRGHDGRSESCESINCTDEYDNVARNIVVDRLAAYEDILFDAEGNEAVTLAHLRELVQAEKEGRLVALPCKVGDTVYMTCTNSVLETKVTEAHISNEICFSTFNANKHGIANYHGFYAEDIGKTVFLTRAAAEAALEAQKGGAE